MKNQEVVKRMARAAGISQAEAADRLGQVVQQILSNLRQGKVAPLPGLGAFKRAGDGRIYFEAAPTQSKGKRA